MILVVIPQISKAITLEATPVKSEVFERRYPAISRKSIFNLKTTEDWLIAVGTIAYKLIPLMLIGTLFTALLSIFPKRSTTYYLSLQSTSYFNNCFFSRNYVIKYLYCSKFYRNIIYDLVLVMGHCRNVIHNLLTDFSQF
jgi:uncharacterized membrane protein YraQ (UPF0718 family)